MPEPHCVAIRCSSGACAATCSCNPLPLARHSAAGSTLWRKDFGSGETFTSVEVDPLDRLPGHLADSGKQCDYVHPLCLCPTLCANRRRLVLCGARGTFIVLQLAKPSSDRVGQRQYQVRVLQMAWV